MSFAGLETQKATEKAITSMDSTAPTSIWETRTRLNIDKKNRTREVLSNVSILHLVEGELWLIH